MSDFKWDDERKKRTGIAEVILCEGKTADQINQLLNYHIELKNSVLLTRIAHKLYKKLDPKVKKSLEYFSQGAIAFYHTNKHRECELSTDVAIVTAGTSDMPVAIEAQKTLQFNGVNAPVINDVGVAGVHRLLSRIDELSRYKILIAVAGMEGALFSVLAGLVKAPVIAVPVSVGYGVSEGGKAALSSALASCAPGVVTVNIDNGFGAAVAALKILHSVGE